MGKPNIYQRIKWFFQNFNLYSLIVYRLQTNGGSYNWLGNILLRLSPKLHLWLYSRREWSVCREFNDGPDDCYLPWRDYWKQVKEVSGYGGNEK